MLNCSCFPTQAEELITSQAHFLFSRVHEEVIKFWIKPEDVAQVRQAGGQAGCLGGLGDMAQVRRAAGQVVLWSWGSRSTAGVGCGGRPPPSAPPCLRGDAPLGLRPHAGFV